MECYIAIMGLYSTNQGQQLLRGMLNETLYQTFLDEFPSYFYYGPTKTAQDLQHNTRALVEALCRAKINPHCSYFDICLIALFGNHD